MKVGDNFWLLPAPINPLMVRVTVIQLTENGCLVDEPVGEVNNPNCMFKTREEAEEALIALHASGNAKIVKEANTDTLEGLRKFLCETQKKMGWDAKFPPPEMVDKKRGDDWFNIEDIERGFKWDKKAKGEKEPVETILYLPVLDPTPADCRELTKLAVEVMQKEAPNGKLCVCFGVNRGDIEAFVKKCFQLKVDLKTPPPGPGREFVKFNK